MLGRRYDGTHILVGSRRLLGDAARRWTADQNALRRQIVLIKGEKKQETEEKKKNYYTSERRYGAFERSFQVPQDVDETKIEASFSKGLLTVTLPKRAEAQKSAKTIAVKAA